MLDRAALFETTIEQLKESGKPMSLSELAAALPPTHDLETLTYWLAMARESGVVAENDRETFDLVDNEGVTTRFDTPLIKMDETSTEELESGTLE